MFCYLQQEKALALFITYSNCENENEIIFKKEESIEILKILGLINNMEEYQEI